MSISPNQAAPNLTISLKLDMFENVHCIVIYTCRLYSVGCTEYVISNISRFKMIVELGAVYLGKLLRRTCSIWTAIMVCFGFRCYELRYNRTSSQSEPFLSNY